MLRRSKWIDAVKRGGITKKKFRNARICSNHFITGKPGRMTDKNDPDWVPTLNMGPHNTIQPSVIVHQQQGSNPEAKVLYKRPGNKPRKPPITLQKNVDRHKNHPKSRRKEGISEKTLENAVVDSQMFRCFLCDKHLLVEGASFLSTLTDTTKVPFRRKLDSMVADLVMGVTSNKDESPNNFIEEVHFTLEQNRTEIHAAEKLTDGSVLDLKNATSYLTQVRKTVGKHSHLYNNYLAILKKFKSHSIDTCDVMEKVTDLFKGHPNLIVGFMRFLPSEYIVDVLCNEQSSTTKRRAFSGHIYNKSSDQPVKHDECSYSKDNLAVPLQKNDDSNVVNGVVSPFNHIKNKCESIPSDNLMVPTIRQSKKSAISSISKRVTPALVRVQENADILFGNHLVSVVRPRRKKSRDSQAIESIETEVPEPMSDKFVPGDATSDDFTENSMEAILQNTNNCMKTLRSELVPTKRQQYYRAKSVVSMSYLDEVKFTFGSESQTYDDFLDIVYKFHTQRMNTPDFIDKLINLFKDHPKLIIEFNKYLPPSYKIEVLGLEPHRLAYIRPPLWLSGQKFLDTDPEVLDILALSEFFSGTVGLLEQGGVLLNVQEDLFLWYLCREYSGNSHMNGCVKYDIIQTKHEELSYRQEDGFIFPSNILRKKGLTHGRESKDRGSGGGGMSGDIFECDTSPPAKTHEPNLQIRLHVTSSHISVRLAKAVVPHLLHDGVCAK
uniref:THAP-type domain-containing protein n=1 Tax=Timema poppense TaxID=170557 RepID=A0A7R9GTD7_TIMPO|nr:unnamed protein product [Timema poppensis]